MGVGNQCFPWQHSTPNLKCTQHKDLFAERREEREDLMAEVEEIGVYGYHEFFWE
jgi:hypothetical protein